MHKAGFVNISRETKRRKIYIAQSIDGREISDCYPKSTDNKTQYFWDL